MIDFDNVHMLVALVSGVFSLLCAAFLAGYALNRTIKTSTLANVKELVDMVEENKKRLTVLEEQYVPVSRYERDLSDLKDLIKEVGKKLESGLGSVQTRIDNLIISKSNV